MVKSKENNVMALRQWWGLYEDRQLLEVKSNVGKPEFDRFDCWADCCNKMDKSAFNIVVLNISPAHRPDVNMYF